jgi:CRP/FNR family cyclic AMP-dependent transcriptional regulator
MTALQSIRLAEAEPELLRFVPAADRGVAAELRLPGCTSGPGQLDLDGLLESSGAFGALVSDGMLLRRARFAQHEGLRLIGPGDVLGPSACEVAGLGLGSAAQVVLPVRIMLLERRALAACRRWPLLVAGLHIRSRETLERLTAQLMICQLPRVEDRVLSLLRLLGDSWGRVTPEGMLVPLPTLTHSVLGGLVGARRPTVTVAVGQLAARGCVERRPEGWLLLRAAGENPEAPTEARPSEGSLAEPDALAELFAQSAPIAARR